MKFIAARDAILTPLQAVAGVVEKRQTMPVLGNVLLICKDDLLTITATDLEVELSATSAIQITDAGEITVPGRKLLDIVKALPEKSEIVFSLESERVIIRSGKSRFTLTTLPAADFPSTENIEIKQKISVAQSDLKVLLEKTHFSMAQQDVRYYLNGLLFEFADKQMRLVATDGHRLALAEMKLKESVTTSIQVILPRKGVLELQRILSAQANVELSLGSNHMRVNVGGIRFTSKLIDGRFPDYSRVIPVNPTRVVETSPAVVRLALQ
ncbi:MAG: DNA polymerase III subunit beta, partial [Nitrosotalea sp.]